MKLPDVTAVSSLLADVSRELILPRFRRLQDADIERKPNDIDPEDIVTIVDRQVEERLTHALTSMTPGVPVLGEEAVHERPSLLELTDSESPVWILDPIDGTKNFAKGDDRFGVMLAWAQAGRARIAWVFLPARREIFVAEAGSGAFRNERRVTVDPGSSGDPPRGLFLTRYMPPSVADRAMDASRGRFAPGPESHCAAVEYMDVLQGANDFIVYYRLMPWDHAAPALILEEGGGRVAHPDGSPYTIRSRDRITVVARNPAIADDVRSWL